MADFTHSFWSWFIGITTILSIVVIIVLTHKVSSRRKGETDESVETMGHVWDEDLAELNNPLPRWWLNMFYISLVWGIGYLILYPGLGAFSGVLGWSQVGQYENEMASSDASYGPLFEQYNAIDIPTLATNGQAVKMGERLFSSYCSTCHGSDARGARGFPNLRDKDWLYGGDPEQISATITNGRSGLMPGWQDLIGDENVEVVTSYVEQLAGREADAKTAAAGKAVYDVNCIACHSADGTGNQLLGAPDLTDDVWLYGGSTTKIRESIATGRNGIMPPHGEFLGPAKIHLLSAYVYQLTDE